MSAAGTERYIRGKEDERGVAITCDVPGGPGAFSGALDVDASVWFDIGQWLVVAVGLIAAGYGLFASVRWIAGLMETWKGRWMPKWPSRRKQPPPRLDLAL